MADRSRATEETTAEAVRETGDAQTAALSVIAAILVVGAAWVLAHLLVPFVLALVLTITLSPLAERLERGGMSRTLSAILCTLLVAAVMAGGVGAIVYEAGTIVTDSDRYIQRFSRTLDTVTRRLHAEGTAASLVPGKPEAGTEERPAGSPSATNPDWERALRGTLGTLGGWAVSGVGGLLGLAGGAVVFLAALFYMLQARDDWLASLKEFLRRLGLRPRDEQLGKVRHEVVTFVGCLSMVACGYVVVVSLALWLVGVPQPLLWGLIAGLFEVVPYFGPLLASVLPTVVALSLDAWWKPAAVAGLFLTLHLVEGYVITPQLYGRAVKFDPVTILFGALFFGWLWGPAGLAAAMPMLILLRGLLVITPDTPALDALAGVGDRKDGAA